MVGKDKLTAFKLNEKDGGKEFVSKSFLLSTHKIAISANGFYVLFVSANMIRLYRTSDVHAAILRAADTLSAPLVEVSHDMPEVSAITMSGDGSSAFLYDTHSVLKFKFRLSEIETAKK